MQQQLLNETRQWIGTRFAHQGRCMKTSTHSGGVDCLGLLIGVADALALYDRHGELLTTYDRRNYSTHPDGNVLYGHLKYALHEIAPSHMCSGDIALFSYERNPQHLGIISAYDSTHLGVIHAYAPARYVVEHVLDDSWREKMVACFRLPALM